MAILPIVLLAVVLKLHLRAVERGGKISLLPWFMELFLAFRNFGSLVDPPPALTAQFDWALRAVLITAITALGVKVPLKALMAVGGGHLAIVVVETLVLLTVATAALAWLDLI